MIGSPVMTTALITGVGVPFGTIRLAKKPFRLTLKIIRKA